MGHAYTLKNGFDEQSRELSICDSHLPLCGVSVLLKIGQVENLINKHEQCFIHQAVYAFKKIIAFYICLYVFIEIGLFQVIV